MTAGSVSTASTSLPVPAARRRRWPWLLVLVLVASFAGGSWLSGRGERQRLAALKRDPMARYQPASALLAEAHTRGALVSRTFRLPPEADDDKALAIATAEALATGWQHAPRIACAAMEGGGCGPMSDPEQWYGAKTNADGKEGYELRLELIPHSNRDGTPPPSRRWLVIELTRR